MSQRVEEARARVFIWFRGRQRPVGHCVDEAGVR